MSKSLYHLEIQPKKQTDPEKLWYLKNKYGKNIKNWKDEKIEKGFKEMDEGRPRFPVLNSRTPLRSKSMEHITFSPPNKYQTNLDDFPDEKEYNNFWEKWEYWEEFKSRNPEIKSRNPEIESRNPEIKSKKKKTLYPEFNVQRLRDMGKALVLDYKVLIKDIHDFITNYNRERKIFLTEANNRYLEQDDKLKFKYYNSHSDIYFQEIELNQKNYNNKVNYINKELKRKKMGFIKNIENKLKRMKKFYEK